MQLSSTQLGTALLPASVLASAPVTEPAPPARWSRWWTSPIARLDYGATSHVPLWHDALVPTQRSLTGARTPSMSYGGTTVEAAIAAAKAMAARPTDLSYTLPNGEVRTVQVHAAHAVLRDAAAGAFWITPLQTTVQLRGEWFDAPHSIDGPAFDGAHAVLRTPTVYSATRDMVAVVGARTVVTPQAWKSAPHDSIIDTSNAR